MIPLMAKSNLFSYLSFIFFLTYDKLTLFKSIIVYLRSDPYSLCVRISFIYENDREESWGEKGGDDVRYEVKCDNRLIIKICETRA